TPCGEQMANPPADALQGAITHDNQTEGYYIVSGGGTAFIDGKVVNGRRSTNNPDGGPNGPGCGGGVGVGSRKVELKVGDALLAHRNDEAIDVLRLLGEEAVKGVRERVALRGRV